MSTTTIDISSTVHPDPSLPLPLSPPCALSPGARERWDFWVPLLLSRGLLRDTFLCSLAVMVDLEEQISQLRKDIEEHGSTQTIPRISPRTGEVRERTVKRPQVRILRNLERSYCEWLEKFCIDTIPAH